MLNQLSKILNDITNDNTSLNELFQSYVMEVQDSNISQEFSYMLRHNEVSIHMIDRAIVEAVKELYNHA